VCVADVALDVRMGSRFHTTSERTLATCSWLRSLVYALSNGPAATSTSSGGPLLQPQPADAGRARATAAAAAFSLGVVVLQNVFAHDSRRALINVLGG